MWFSIHGISEMQYLRGVELGRASWVAMPCRAAVLRWAGVFAGGAVSLGRPCR
eukprot:NODE_15762_length_1032_cov_1.449724.p7 GENE.NODE_15762_length_1032_cov_1.449724~~NODE_15762_length_1032_cov_1.449724.p7  ORF type:complete len:53 (-),score=3.68 NODE_15762_length_1032_cov_1.449724:408-566(-)